MNPLRKAIYISLKYVAPAVVILMPLGALWGHFHPWPPAQTILDQMSERTPIPIGFRESHTYVATFAGENRSREVSRIYLLVPSRLAWPEVVTVSQTNEEPPNVSEPSRSSFLLLLVTYIATCISTWWYWLRANRPHAA